MAKTSQAQLKAAEKYLSGQRQIVVRFDKEKEADLIAWIEKKGIQAYIKILLRRDMENACVFDVEDEAGNKIEREIPYDEAMKSVELYELDDSRDGTYIEGSYYIRNTVTDYCERIFL